MFLNRIFHLRVIKTLHWMILGILVVFMLDSSSSQAKENTQSLTEKIPFGIMTQHITEPAQALQGFELTPQELNWLAENQIIKIAVEKSSFPFEFIDEEGNISGISGDYLKEIAKRLNVEFVWAGNENWADGLLKVKSGDAAMVALITPTKERESFLSFTDIYLELEFVIVSHDESTVFSNIDALDGKTIAQIEGTAVIGYLREHYPNIKIIERKTRTETHELLSSGGVDAVIEDVNGALGDISKHGFKNLSIVGTTPYSEVSGIGVSSDLPLLKSALNKALADISLSKRSVIFSKWLTQRGIVKIDYGPLYYVIGLAVFGGLIFLFWYRRLRKEVLRRRVVEKQYNSLIDNSPLFICELDLKGKISSINSGGVKVLNLPSESDAIGLDYCKLATANEYSFLKRKFEEAVAGETSSFYFSIKTADAQIELISNFLPLLDEEGKVFKLLVISEDVTKLKKVDNLQKHHQYLLNQTVMVITSDIDGYITYVNNNFCKISGYSEQETLGQSLKFLGIDNQSEQFKQDIWARISKGDIWRGEQSAKTKAGAEYWIETIIVPHVDELGAIFEYVSLCTDVTERKLTEEKLRHAMKTDALGQLSSGIAHDFNNLLGIISGNLEVMEMLAVGDVKILDCIDTAKQGTERGAALTSKLLGFAPNTAYSIDSVGCNALLTDMAPMIRATCIDTMSLKMDLQEGLWAINVNKEDLENAILNLALNSRDAMPDGGTLLIETANITLDHNYVKQNPGSKEGDFVTIAINDTGTGIAEEVKFKITEPFFTTKPVGEGTGLGLSMVQGLVIRAGGHLEITSKLGHYATIKLYLPKAS